MHRALSFALFIATARCATGADVPVPRFYEYWQRGPDGVGPMGTPTQSYRELFSVRGPQKKFYDATDRDFYYAALGDARALHRFLHSSTQYDAGAPSEAWVADMVVLILVYGDVRLHDALLREAKNVREQVGGVIEQQMQQDIHQYPRTRALYKFRKRPNQSLERTADRRGNLFSMTSTRNFEAQLAIASGRSACSR